MTETAPVADSKAAIRDEARRLGFDAVGFAAARADAADARNLQAFLARRLHGDMAWMEREPQRRADPQALWADARSVVVLGLNYGPHGEAPARLKRPGRGAISVYAHGRDYHDVVKARLKRLASWMTESFDCAVKVFVDTAPVMEKPLAARAGIGWQGKHTNLLSRDFGSWLFLGEVFTTLELAPDAPAADHCGSCDACRQACPTGALPEPYRINPLRCISYLTIEHKGSIPQELRAAMGNRVYGCDDCLAVCPWNKFAKPSPEPALLPRAELDAPRLADLAQLDDATFRRVFAGSPIKRTGRDRFVRNVAIAIGNSGDAAHLPALRRLLDDPSALVREAARWALAHLEAGSARQPQGERP